MVGIKSRSEMVCFFIDKWKQIVKSLASIVYKLIKFYYYFSDKNNKRATMFGKKKHPEEIENLIRKKINNKDTDFAFHIKEVKVKDKYSPMFKLFLINDGKHAEINLFGHKVEGVQLYYISKFIFDLKEGNKDFNITYKIEALMPQYNNMLTNQLEESLEKRHSFLDATKIIKDLHEEKIAQLTVAQQKELFIDLCYAGNEAPIKKLLNFSVISSTGKAQDILKKDAFNKFDIIYGIEKATSYGYLDVVKTILENEHVIKAIDFSSTSSDLLTVLDTAIRKERKDVIAYLFNEKEYKLSTGELYHLRNNQRDAAFAEVLNNYEKKT